MYTTEQKDRAAHLLCEQFPHLHYGVARKWVTGRVRREQQRLRRQGERHPPDLPPRWKPGSRRLRPASRCSSSTTASGTPSTPRTPSPFGLPILRTPCHSAGHRALSIAMAQRALGTSGNRGGLDAYYTRLFRSFGYRGPHERPVGPRGRRLWPLVWVGQPGTGPASRRHRRDRLGASSPADTPSPIIRHPKKPSKGRLGPDWRSRADAPRAIPLRSRSTTAEGDCHDDAAGEGAATHIC